MSRLRDFSDMVGGYWAEGNARFERSNPSLAQRVGRVINPLTGLGSAVGDMYTSAGKGDVAGMGLAAASAAPLSGWARTAKAIDPAVRVIEAQGLRGAKSQAATAAASEMYNADASAEPAAPPPARPSRPDFSSRYNTPLIPQDEQRYQAWA